MTLFLPRVPSRIDSFNCIPEINPLDPSDQFEPLEALEENKFKFYFNVSPLNSKEDVKYAVIRFLTVDSNRNPISNKFPLGVYFAEIEEDVGGTFFKVPAGLFITTRNSTDEGAFVSESGTRITKRIKSGITSTVSYSDLVSASGINEFYRSQIKVLDGTASLISNSWVFTPTGLSQSTVTIDYLNPISNQYISDWSEQTLMKPFFIGDLTDNNFGLVGLTSRETLSLAEGNTVTAEFFSFQFKYFNTDEPLRSYQFKVYDSSKNLYDDSGLLEVDRFLTFQSFVWTNIKPLSNSESYFITLTFITTTGFSFTYQYSFMVGYSIIPLGLNFNARNDAENGRIEFEMFGTQVNFIGQNGISGYQFINSDDMITGPADLKENALEVTATVMTNQQPLIFNTNYNSWSLQGIFGGITPKTNSTLDYETLESDFMFKLVDNSDDSQFSYYVVPVVYSQPIDPSYTNISWAERKYNEFNLVKKTKNTAAGTPGQPLLLNDGFNRTTSSQTVSQILTSYTAFMTPDNSKLGVYAPINGTSSNTAYSSAEDISNKYYIFLGEVGGAPFIYAKHLNLDDSLKIQILGDINTASAEISGIIVGFPGDDLFPSESFLPGEAIFSSIYRGMSVEGPGIRPNTFITSVQPDSLGISSFPMLSQTGQNFILFSNIDRLHSQEV